MRAGRLRQRLRITRPTEQVDASGSHSEGFKLVEVRWGSVEGLRGREFFEAGAPRGEVDVRIVLRSPTEVRISDRIEQGSRKFDVQSIVDVAGRGRQIEVMAKEYVP